MAPQPTVSFLNGATLDSLIGTQVTTTLRFDNTASGTDVGYAPFINLILPTNGADGPGAGNSPVNDGVTFVSAQYLGADLEVVSREFPTSGVVNHPFAKLPSGAPMTVTGTPGTTLLVLKLPFGSFTTTQTPANIELKLNISNLADLNAPLPIQATAGFAFGADALDNTAADPVILGTATTQTLNPTVAKLDKIYSGPEQETATGPSYERIWQVQANFAPGQPFTNVTLTDRVPDGVIIVGTPRLHDGAGNVLPGSVSVTGLYGSQVITAVFDGTIIGGAVKPTLEFNWYVTEFLSTGAPVLDPDDGTFHPLLNDAKLVSSWNPIDGRDPITSTTIDPAGPEDIVTAKSIAIQKGVALVNGDADSNGVPDWQPGGTLQYTLAGQVSNYFEMKELNVYDTLGDGQTFNAGFTPTIVIREGGVPIYTGPVQYTLDAKGTDGKTPVTFHVSNTLIANSQDGVLDGNGGVLGDVPHATDYNQATVLITFQSTLDMNWTGPVPGDDRVDQGDRVGNTADFGGDVFLTEIERRDDSSAGVSLPINDIGKSINVDKSIYAINGDTSQGTNSLAIKPLIQAGDLVTYRIKLDIPLTSSHDVTLKDFLPLPVFLANDPDANGVASGFTYAGITNTPGAGEWSLMTSDQLRINAPGVIAGVSVTQDAVGNSVLWNFGDIINNAYPRTLLDMLFTVRVNDSPLGDGLLLTNQVTITETNSFNAVFEENDIIQFVLGEPRLKITKGVVAENNTAAGYTVNATTNGSEVGPAGVTWNAPGSATPFSGTITSAGLASRPVDADLFQADARDTVTFAVVLENIGSASRGAFDTLIRDTIPTGFTLGAVPLNLNVVDGTGATVAYTGAPADLFTTGIELLDPDARQGAVGAFSLTSGKNIVVITYDLRLDDNVPVMERLVNTATTADYAAEEGGENRTATDNLPDSNTAFVEITPKIGKEVIASSNPDTGNTEGNDDFADLTIGETVTWRVTVTVPEGVSKNLTIRDVLPGGVGASTSGPFELVSVTTATVGSNITGSGVLAGSTGVISNSNGDAWMDTVVFSFGDVTNAPDNVENAADQISFDITASVLDTPGNVRGQTETNIATVSVTDSMGAVKNTSVTSSVELVEPQLAITKSVANLTQPSLTNAGTGNASGDANDVFLYTVRLQNRGGDANAPAYEVSIDDLLADLPPNLVFEPGSVVLTGTNPAGTAIITGNGASDSVVKVTTPRMLEDEVVTLTFRAVVVAGAISGQIEPNTASATGTSVPGTPPSDRPFTVTDNAQVTIAAPSITKSVWDTTFDDTGSAQHNGGLKDVKVDDIVTYRMVVTVPEGQSINFRVVDTLADELVSGSSGLLQYIPGSAKVISAGANLSSTTGILTPTVSATDSNANGTTDRVTYSFGNVTNTADNVSDVKDQITFEIQARAQNVPANQNADVLTNRVQAFTDFSQSSEATASVDLVQPELDVQKTTTLGTGDAADIATYTVVVRHTAASTAHAYNIALGDILPPGVTLVPLSATTTDGMVTEVAGGIQLNMASYTLGSAPITITYQVKLADNVVDGQVIRNTVNLEYRTDPTPGRILTDSDDATINVDINDTIVKDIIATSNAYTPGNTLVPGEEVTFRLTVTLGEGAQRLTVQDALPAGLEYVSSSVTSLGDITGSALAVGAVGTHDPLTNVLNFNFGNVINPGNNIQNAADQVVIEVVTKVAAGVAANTNLTNIGTVTPFVPNNTYGVTPGTPMPPSADNEVVNVQGLAAVGDRAFIDLNADGQQQGAEPGLAGVQVQLFNADTGALVGTQTTNGSGLYLFTNLQPGKYYEVWNLPSGYVRTDADAGPDASDSDPATTGPNAGRTADFTLLVNQTDVTRDAGYWVPVRLGDKVFEDQNGNGIQDGADTPMANVTVNLLNAGGTVIGTQQTDSNGNYLFTDLKPGTYSVEFIRPAGFVFTDSDTGANDAIDSDAHVTTGRTVAKTYISGDDDRTIDAGMYRPVTIGDTVFQDNNGNGIQDTGDTPLGGVTVNLRDGSNGLVGTLVTDSSGQYLFTGLKPGSYRVEVIKPTGYIFTAADAGGNDATDSDTDVTTGLTPLKTYASGADDRTVDSGLFQPVKLGDQAWIDRDGDGIQDPGEAPLAGVQVQLVNNATGAVIATATTGADGKYEFIVPPGTYREIWTPPAGYVPTITGQGTAATDSNVNPATGQTGPIVAVSGQDDMTWDGGFYIPVRIGDRVFEDQNADGIQDAGDTNLANVRVDLLDGSGNVLATQFTDVNGNYLFTGLRPQDYAVKFTAPVGFNITDRDVGSNDAIDSDTSPITGVTVTKTYFSGDVDLTMDAGMWRPVTIGDRAWEDQNANGVQDGADTPMAGVTVNLFNGSGVVVGTQPTDGSGNYLFTGLKPGTYSVEFVRPAGFVFTALNVGANDAIDSDASITTGRTEAKTYTSGNDDRTVDGGMYRPVTIGDTVFEDQNGNGIQDAEDTNLANVRVDLLDGSGNVVGTQLTDVTGNYLFTGLRPQDYAVKFTAPVGFNITDRDVGSNDAIDSDTSPMTGVTGTKTYVSGDVDLTIDAGMWRPVTIGDRAWVDINGDGLQQTLEPGLGGVTVRLIDDRTGAVVGTQTTDPSGNYLFTGYKPSEYHVEFAPPAGWDETTPLVGGNRAIDSNPNAAGVAPQIRLLSGQEDRTIDAGYVDGGKVTGHVFLQLPPGICGYKLPDAVFAGIKVELITTSGIIARTTTTDAQGQYGFVNLVPGTYVTRFTAPDGIMFSLDKQAGTLDPWHSDVNPDGVTDAFTINLGQHVAQLNAGLAYKNVGLTGNPGQVLSTPGSYNFDHPGAYVIGLNGSYNMMGNGGAPYFIGGTGDNNLQAGGSQGSIMVGGHGSNIFEGSSGRDIIIGGCGPNNMQGLGNNGLGLGTASGCWNYDLLVGGPQADIITGNHGRSIMLGGRGNDAIDGFGMIVGGPNSGTISFSGGQFSNFTVGDHIKAQNGQTTIHYQVGDGVQWIEGFNPARGDTIEVWGYGAPTAMGTVNGMGVLYFGPNAALVFNGWQPAQGPLTGINYHAGQAQMAGAFGRFDALPPVVLYNGLDSFYGTQGDDIAIGSNFPTTFRANGGDDLLIGGNGNNLFIGGAGNDQMIGGQGNDIFRIGQGSDAVVGCGGNNVVQLDYTAAQVTVVNKGNGHYVLMTPAGEQHLSGIQWVSFTDQNLRLSDVAAAPGAVLFGTSGHDGFQIHSAADMIVERVGSGNDAAWVSADGWIMSPEVEVARLIGSAANIKGNALDNIIVANAGRTSHIDAEGGHDEIWGSDNNGEILNGGAGDDIIRSGLGTSTMIGGAGNDQFVVNNAGDVVVERPGEGIDTAWVSVNGWTVGDNIEIVRLFGNATSVNVGTSGAQVVANTSGSVITAQLGDNVFWGQGGNDTFVGGAGNDIFYAGGGATTMYGGSGHEHFIIKNLGDRAFENANEGYDTAWVAVSGWTVGDHIEVAYLSGNATTLNGNATGGNLVANSTAASTLNAGDGYTIFWGSNFNDTFKVGTEGGVMYGYGGADDLVFGAPGWGTVEVADFSRAEGDQIHFAGSGITHMDQLNIVAYADKTQIQHGADQIILYGVTAPMHASDFVF